jgi:putative peptide zinc metalloprotease protein
MTAHAGSPFFNAQEIKNSAASTGTAGCALAALRTDVRLLPVTDPLLPDWTLFDPARGRYFKVGWVEFEMLSRWYLGDRDSIINDINATTTLHVTPAQFDALLDMLAENELLRADTSDHVAQLLSRKNAGNGSVLRSLFTFTLFYRQPLFNPNRLLGVLERLIKPALQYKGLLTGIVSLLLCFAVVGISAHAYEFKDQFALFASAPGMFYFFCVLVFTNVAHEFGHGIVARHYGCNVRTMGVALIFMIPVCYCDTTDAWRLKSRYQRQLINAGGILMEAGIALCAVVAWLLLPEGTAKSLAFFLAVTSLGTTLLINLNPFLKFDGYFLVADHLQIDNLQKKSFAAMQWQIRSWITGAELPYPDQVPPAKHNTLCTYASCTWVYRLFLYVAIALMVYSFWFKALGVLLLAGVVLTLIVTPVAREMVYFFRALAGGAVNSRSIFTLLCAGLFVALLVIPLPRGVSAPALLSSAQATTHVASRPAQVESVLVAEGQHVSKGELLVSLRDPDLLFERRRLEAEVEYLTKLLRQQVTQTEPDQSRVGQQDINSRLQSLADINLQIDNLNLYAAHDGTANGFPLWLKPGVWVSKNEALVNVVSDIVEVRAYVAARDVERISSLDGVLSLEGDRSPLETTGLHITNDSVRTLEDKILAIPFGGDIAVKTQSNGDLVPILDWHQVSLAANEVSNRERSGYVVFEAGASSLAASVGSRVYGVLLRESGF